MAPDFESLPKRIVWVVNNKEHDLSKATRFGEMLPLFNGNVNILAVDNNLKHLRKKLELSGPEDYLLVCGSIPANMLAACVMMWLHGKVNLLMFDQRDKEYKVRIFEMDDLEIIQGGNGE